MFPAEVASVLSGASMSQLKRWRQTDLLIPEDSEDRLYYSFRDVVALRTVVWLRAELSLQKVRRAFSNLPVYGFTAHPAEYRFGVSGDTIAILDDRQWMDLVKNPGQNELFRLADVFKPFSTQLGKR